MNRFTSDEIAFDVPDDWTDASTTKFVFPETNADVSLVQIGGAGGMPLDVCAQVLLQQLTAAHPELELIRRRIEPDRWVELVVEWPQDGASVRGVVRSFVVEDRIWTLFARMPSTAVEDLDLVIARTMASFAARE